MGVEVRRPLQTHMIGGYAEVVMPRGGALDRVWWGRVGVLRGCGLGGGDCWGQLQRLQCTHHIHAWCSGTSQPLTSCEASACCHADPLTRLGWLMCPHDAGAGGGGHGGGCWSLCPSRWCGDEGAVELVCAALVEAPFAE